MAMIADAFVGKCLEVLSNLIAEEAVIILGVKDDLKRLQEKLEMIKSVLSDAERRRLEDESTKLWLCKLKDAIYDADDILDLCKIKGHHFMQGSASTSSSVHNRCRFPLFSSCSNAMSSIRFRHEIGKEIQKLNRRLENISRDRQSFTLQGLGGSNNKDVVVTRVNRGQSYPLPPSDFVGRETKLAVDRLVDSLVKEDGERLLVFAIVGLGGIGKTTLAQKIYSHQKVQDHFQKILWVCVSQKYSEEELLKEMIRSAGGDHGCAQTKAELLPLIRTVLTGKRFLIVLDDVWRADVWEDLLQTPLGSAGMPFSRVLVTSRNEDIAKSMRAIQTHRVEKLHANDGWDLLCKSVFENGIGEDIHDLREIGMKIVEKCDGLPLAIKAIGGVLRTKNMSRREWEIVNESHAWSVRGELPEEVRGALYLSYEDLPSQLKQCFLFCSLFPEDNRFVRPDLIQWWVSEGFVTTQGDSLLEDVAEEFYNILTGRSLVHLVPNFLDRSRCTMHDLTRSLALFLTRDESHLVYRNDNATINSSKIRRLAIYEREETEEVLNAIENPQCLRTLRAIGCLQVKTHQLFQRFTRLRILNLTGSVIGSIPKSIQNLHYLRYLDLDGTEVCELPESLGSLTSLQFLNLNRCELLHTLPRAITQLLNLRRLGLWRTPVRYVPSGIGELRNLNDLQGFVVGDGDCNDDRQLGCHLNELQSMSQLRTIHIVRLERLQTGGFQPLKDKHRLKELTLQWSDNVDQSLISGITAEAYESISPSSNLATLYVVSFPGFKFPKWISMLHNLTLLSLIKCFSCQAFPPLGTLQQLKALYINSAPAIVNIGLEFLGLDAIEGLGNRDVITAFPKLEKLYIYSMHNWEEWTIDTQAVYGGTKTTINLLPRLQELHIIDCPKLRHLPEGLKHATALKILGLSNTDRLLEIKNIPSLETLQVIGSQSLVSISDLPALRDMEIIRSCKLLKFVENLGTLQRLKLVLEDDWINCLPEWLLHLIHKATANGTLHILYLSCNEALRGKCTEGRQYWPLLSDIPDVTVTTSL